jgi:hypothetical protein
MYTNTVLGRLGACSPLQQKPCKLCRNAESHARHTQPRTSQFILGSELPHDRLKSGWMTDQKTGKFRAAYRDEIVPKVPSAIDCIRAVTSARTFEKRSLAA